MKYSSGSISKMKYSVPIQTARAIYWCTLTLRWITRTLSKPATNSTTPLKLYIQLQSLCRLSFLSPMGRNGCSGKKVSFIPRQIIIPKRMPAIFFLIVLMIYWPITLIIIVASHISLISKMQKLSCWNSQVCNLIKVNGARSQPSSVYSLYEMIN